MIDDAEVTTSPVVNTIYEHLLGAISEGTLEPGDRISDAQLAGEFGVSRTPVREAIQRLRDIGVIEASANRFTRVAVVTPPQTAKAMTVWVALYSALVLEVITEPNPELAERMERDHDEFNASLASGDFVGMARANFAFFDRLAHLTTNEVLARSITSVVHMVRLGSMHLPEAIDVSRLSRLQSELLAAIRVGDRDAAVAVIAGLRDIRIPQD